MATVHLQGLGSVEAIPVQDLKPGDILHYNQTWGEYVVVSIEPKGKSVSVMERNIKTGKTSSRLRRVNTLVAFSRGQDD